MLCKAVCRLRELKALVASTNMNNIDYMHLKLSKLCSPMHARTGRTDLLEVCFVVY